MLRLHVEKENQVSLSKDFDTFNFPSALDVSFSTEKTAVVRFVTFVTEGVRIHRESKFKAWLRVT